LLIVTTDTHTHTPPTHNAPKKTRAANLVSYTYMRGAENAEPAR